jgi:hypothetical protein
MMDPRLRRLHRCIETAIAGLSTEQATWHPPGKWCTAEVLEHLYLTYTGTMKGFERVMQAGKPLASPTTWQNRSRTFVVTSLGYLPSGREAPPTVRPRGIDAEKILAEIGPKIAAMDAAIGECAQKFGARKKLLDHPILGPLTAGQWCKFHLVHGLHHLKQIQRLREGSLA